VVEEIVLTKYASPVVLLISFKASSLILLSTYVGIQKLAPHEPPALQIQIAYNTNVPLVQHNFDQGVAAASIFLALAALFFQATTVNTSGLFLPFMAYMSSTKVLAVK
jgi:hypothetical protein